MIYSSCNQAVLVLLRGMHILIPDYVPLKVYR